MNTTTRIVADKYRINYDNLDAFMLRCLHGYEGPLEVKEFAGGGSNPTFLLSTPQKQYVLRRKPIGTLIPGAHAIDREFRAMSALYPSGYPIPRPLKYCSDVSVIGAEFYLMEYVAGRIFLDYALPGLKPAERFSVYDSMNAAVARLHCLDYRAAGLADFGKAGNYFDRQILLWRRQYERAGRSIPEFASLADWLSAHVLNDELTSIVHGDFSLQNCLVHPSEPKIIAVLDWELSTIGHPLADVAYNLSHWYLPNFRTDAGYQTLVSKDVTALGIPTMEEYIDLYAGRINFPVSKRGVNFAIAFSLFRLAGISIGAAARAADGTAKNEAADAAASYIMPLLDAAWAFARKAGA